MVHLLLTFLIYTKIVKLKKKYLHLSDLEFKFNSIGINLKVKKKKIFKILKSTRIKLNPLLFIV